MRAMTLFFLFLTYQPTNITMKKILLSVALLIATGMSAQEYEWQWAKRGGGVKKTNNDLEGLRGYDSEQIVDIVVDSDNNYYYLAFISQGSTQFESTPIPVYNPQMQVAAGTDIVIISTDCEGNLRWTQTIGGGNLDHAYKIVVDNEGGLYLGANVFNNSSSLDEYLPPHFSPTDALPVLVSNTGEPQEGYKTIALLKYNTTDGSLAWRVMPQGDVTSALRYAHINQVAIDSEGIVHTLIGFSAGTHLNGQVVVPETFTNSYKYHIVKFNADGDVVGVQPLSLEGALLEHNTHFRYDEELQRYYLAGFRNYGSVDPLLPLSFNGSAFTEQAYILAFGPTGEEIWKHEIISPGIWSDDRVFDIEIDENSNIYLSGLYFSNGNEFVSTLNGFEFPTNLTGHVTYVLKLNSSGMVQWISKPTGYTESANPNTFSGTQYPLDLAVKGDEIAVAVQGNEEIWGSVSIDRPVNHLNDPVLLRINKGTGAAFALHDIMTTAGTRDGLSAVAVDNDGNYVIGGYFFKDLFTEENDNVPTVTKVGGVQDFTDFFVAKLAAGECGTLVTNKVGYNTIKVYPNPTSGLVNIQSQEELSSYEVVNLLGQVLLKGQMKQGQNSIMIDSLSTGTFILNITTAEGKVISQKVVRE